MKLILLLLIFYPSAYARRYDDYRADYAKGAFCSSIGGACAADDDPENSFFQNPASLAFADRGLIFDGDYNSTANPDPGMKLSSYVKETTYMGGIAWSGYRYGAGIAMSGRKYRVDSQATIVDAANNAQTIGLGTTANTLNIFLPFSYKISENMSVGISFEEVFHSTSMLVSNGSSASSTRSEKFTLPAITLGILKEKNLSMRWGAWARTPLVHYSNINLTTQAGGSQIYYNEDYAIYMPWIAAGGIALMPFQDSRTLFLDINIIGNTPNGFLLTYDTFSSTINGNRLLEKGRTITFEPRIGWRSPWWQGSNGKYMAGTYLEYSRTESVQSRLHGTAGISYKAFGILDFMIGLDFAKNFNQLLLTVQ